MFLNVFVFFLLIAVVHSYPTAGTNFSEFGISVPSCLITASPLVGESVQERILAQINLIKMEVNEAKSLLPGTGSNNGQENSLSQFLHKNTKIFRNR